MGYVDSESKLVSGRWSWGSEACNMLTVLAQALSLLGFAIGYQQPSSRAINHLPPDFDKPGNLIKYAWAHIPIDMSMQMHLPNVETLTFRSDGAFFYHYRQIKISTSTVILFHSICYLVVDMLDEWFLIEWHSRYSDRKFIRTN